MMHRSLFGDMDKMSLQRVYLEVLSEVSQGVSWVGNLDPSQIITSVHCLPLAIQPFFDRYREGQKVG